MNILKDMLIFNIIGDLLIKVAVKLKIKDRRLLKLDNKEDLEYLGLKVYFRLLGIKTNLDIIIIIY